MYTTEGFEAVLTCEDNTEPKAGFRFLESSKKSSGPEKDDVRQLEFAALSELLDRPWFHRLWVIQEVALAPASKAFCGRHEFDIVDLIRSALRLMHKTWYISANTAEKVTAPALMQYLCDRTYGMVPETNAWRHFHTLLITIEYMKCSDPRDRIFGILGLVGHPSEATIIPPLLMPDYNKSTAVVFRDATRFICAEERSLSVLRMIQHRDQSDITSDEYLSWTVRWSRVWDDHKDPQRLRSKLYSASAGQATMAKISINMDHDPNPNVFSMDGFVVDKVLKVSDMPTQARWSEGAEELLSLYSRAHSLAAEAAKDRDNTDENARWTNAVWSTLVVGSLEMNTRASESDIAETARACWDFLEQQRQVPSYNSQLINEKADPATRAASRYIWASVTAFDHRLFFTTVSGYIGLGPKVMREDDVVVILSGGEWPFILRPCGAAYQFIGQSYVHGIMDGEAVYRNEEKGGKDMVFDLI